MATAITTTPQNITGDFDLVVRATTPAASGFVALQKSLGATTTNWKTLEVFSPASPPVFVKNSGENSFRIASDVDGIACEFSQ